MADLSPATPVGLGASMVDRPFRSLDRPRRWISGDAILAGCSRVGAFSVVAMLVVLLAVLTTAAWPSIETFGWKFLITSQWRPNELNVPVATMPVR